MMYMNTAMNYESIFGRYGGIMCTCEITGKGISYQMLQNLIKQGRVLFFWKIKTNYPLIKNKNMDIIAVKEN